jgi:uncharacterized protein YwgA
MMDVPDAIIVTLGVSEDKVVGRTAIQKLIYFETVFNLADVAFRPHYYGPYSSEVAGIIQELVSLGFIEEKIETRETTGYPVSDDWKRYCYKLTNDGLDFLRTVERQFSNEYKKISELVEMCKRRSNLNPKILSWAAKVNYIGAHEEKSVLESEEIKTRAKALKWNLSDEQIGEATKLLSDLGLVKII